MKERNIRLIVSYDGTDFRGYQRQVNGLTIQECLEEALSKVCNENITVHGSSRTDAGVHAKFQVVSFCTHGNIPTRNLTRALIAHLPKTIVVRLAEEVPLDWRVRNHTVGKEYVYTIHNGVSENPLSMRYHWHVKDSLCVQSMTKAAVHLLGTHDFTTLKGTNTTPADPVKTIYGIKIEKEKQVGVDDILKIHVIGDGFLYHMVRNIAGLLVDVGRSRIAADSIPTLLEGKNRRLIGKTAPPQGLCLEEVFFDKERLNERLHHLGIRSIEGKEVI